tara:strand:- start:14037 stop:14477 length:441 start_codon:yes stop_codon:yes gene_type:complete
MKKFVYTIAFIFASLTAVTAQEWQTNFDTAKEIAISQDRPIILVFQGSDWCAPCIKLDREVFSTDTFKTFAKEHYVMLKADFPKRKKNALSEEQQKLNNGLAEKYNKRGIFPLVVVLDKNGTVLGETGYFKASPSQYIAHIEEIKG